MLKQGDLIKISLYPIKEHEQASYRSALLIKAVDLKARNYKIVKTVNADMLWNVTDFICGYDEIEKKTAPSSPPARCCFLCPLNKKKQ
jgi:hypothetical protein